ncbi:hypothetical protein Plhal304r1_c029g0094271 [Plasmopara halstedii]
MHSLPALNADTTPLTFCINLHAKANGVAYCRALKFVVCMNSFFLFIVSPFFSGCIFTFGYSNTILSLFYRLIS